MNPVDPRRSRGFTLIETMLALGVAAIVSSIAYPSLEGHLLRARRVDGLTAVLQAQLAQERLRANRSSYGSLAEIGVGPASTAGHYAIAARGDVDGYEVSALATGAQARDRACRSLRLRSVPGGVEYASGADAASSNPPAANRKCWNQ